MKHVAETWVAASIYFRGYPLAVAAFFLMSFAACATVPSESDVEAAEKRYLLGADYFGKGMVPAAQEELRRALALNPQSVDALYLSGLIYIRQAVETQDLTVRAQCLPREEAKLEMEDVDSKMRKAGEIFRKVCALRANHSEAWNALAAVEIHFHHWDEVIADSTKALENPTYQTPWFALTNQGMAYREKRDYLRSGKVLRDALSQNAKFCVARWRLGQVYYDEGEYERSSQELQVLRDDKNCPIQEAFLLAGLVSLRRQDRKQAEEAFHQCQRLAPKSCIAKECRIAE